ncbi:MAG: hypothetical protein WBP52_18825 [Terriglobales bacterium]|jgi:hypothetical protein
MPKVPTCERNRNCNIEITIPVEISYRQTIGIIRNARHLLALKSAIAVADQDRKRTVLGIRDHKIGLAIAVDISDLQ